MLRSLLVEHPELVVVLGLVMRAALAWQSELSWYEYRTLHGLKRLAFPPLARFAPVSLINEKGGTDDAEYLQTRDESIRAVVSTLRQGGFELHLLCSLKRRPDGTLTAAHLIYRHDGGEQTEAFLFANDDGSTDVYAHHEPDPSRPLAHLGGANQSDGDPEGVVAQAFDRNA